MSVDVSMDLNLQRTMQTMQSLRPRAHFR